MNFMLKFNWRVLLRSELLQSNEIHVFMPNKLLEWQQKRESLEKPHNSNHYSDRERPWANIPLLHKLKSMTVSVMQPTDGSAKNLAWTHVISSFKTELCSSLFFYYTCLYIISAPVLLQWWDFYIKFYKHWCRGWSLITVLHSDGPTYITWQQWGQVITVAINWSISSYPLTWAEAPSCINHTVCHTAKGTSSS